MSDTEENRENEILSDTEDEHIDVVDEDSDEVDPMNYVSGLIKLSKNIIKLKDVDDDIQRRSRRPPVLQKLINYEKSISKLEFDDLVASIFEIYKKNRKTILQDDHSWLLNSDLAFEYIRPGFKPKSYKQRNEICISRIYQMAGELYEKHSHDKVTGGRNKYNYIPTSFIRYLYLLFMESIESNKDQDILGKLIDKAETQLGITDGSYTEDFENDLFGGGLFSGNFKGGIETIMKVVFDAFKKNDVKLPEGMSLENFNFGDISSLASKLFDSKDSFISDILKEVGTCENSGDLVKLLMEKIKDPEILTKLTTLLKIDIPHDKITEIVNSNQDAISSIIKTSFPDIKKEMNNISNASKENKSEVNGTSGKSEASDSLVSLEEVPSLIEVPLVKESSPVDITFVDSKPIEASPLPSIDSLI